jgi:hypothetical protein
LCTYLEDLEVLLKSQAMDMVPPQDKVSDILLDISRYFEGQ